MLFAGKSAPSARSLSVALAGHTDMMILPDLIKPSSVEQVQIAPGEYIDIPKAIVTFSSWSGEAITDNYNGKQIINYKGKPAFAELAILWEMREAKWDGVWIDTYRKKYRTDYWGNEPESILPKAQSIILENIFTKSDSRYGAWDVYCWSKSDIIFIEAKRSHKDNIRKTQINWLRSALSIGLKTDNFLFVEWCLR